MATRSLIGKKIGDDKYKYIYCHWDGYLSYVGCLLLEHYGETELEKLFENGDVSTLGETPEENVDGWKLGDNTIDKTRYYKTRGETDIEPKIADSKKDLVERAWNCGAEYIYIFDDGEWTYCEDFNLSGGKYNLGTFSTLTEERCNY